MLGLVARDWWVYAVRGVAAIIFGMLALVWPGATLAILVILFGAYALSTGSRCSLRSPAATSWPGAIAGPLA